MHSKQPETPRPGTTGRTQPELSSRFRFVLITA